MKDAGDNGSHRTLEQISMSLPAGSSNLGSEDSAPDTSEASLRKWHTFVDTDVRNPRDSVELQIPAQTTRRKSVDSAICGDQAFMEQISRQLPSEFHGQRLPMNRQAPGNTQPQSSYHASCSQMQGAVSVGRENPTPTFDLQGPRSEEERAGEDPGGPDWHSDADFFANPYLKLT